MEEVEGDRLRTLLGEVAVVRASPADAAAILSLRNTLAGWMLECGIEQWQPGDMPLAWIEECVARGWIFVAQRGGDLVASVTLVWSDPFIWAARNEAAGYIHMLMVDRAYAHIGLGRSLLEWAERRIATEGHRRARLDCVRTNLGLRAYYEAVGYAHIGDREFSGPIPAVALYEKLLAV